MLSQWLWPKWCRQSDLHRNRENVHCFPLSFFCFRKGVVTSIRKQMYYCELSQSSQTGMKKNCFVRIWCILQGVKHATGVSGFSLFKKNVTNGSTAPDFSGTSKWKVWVSSLVCDYSVPFFLSLPLLFQVCRIDKLPPNSRTHAVATKRYLLDPRSLSPPR